MLLCNQRVVWSSSKSSVLFLHPPQGMPSESKSTSADLSNNPWKTCFLLALWPVTKPDPKAPKQPVVITVVTIKDKIAIMLSLPCTNTDQQSVWHASTACQLHTDPSVHKKSVLITVLITSAAPVKRITWDQKPKQSSHQLKPTLFGQEMLCFYWEWKTSR